MPLTKMTRIVDDKGTPAYLEAEGSIACTLETYRDIREISAPWRD